MQDDERLTPAEQELERALASLTPTGPGANRDRLMFRAGRAAGRRGRWLWPGASAAAAAAIAVALTVSLTARPQPQPAERIVRVPVEARAGASIADTEAEPAEDRWADHARYAALRDEVLAKGPDALPAPASAAANCAPTLEDLLGTRRPKPPTPAPDPLGRLATMLFGDRS